MPSVLSWCCQSTLAARVSANSTRLESEIATMLASGLTQTLGWERASRVRVERRWPEEGFQVRKSSVGLESAEGRVSSDVWRVKSRESSADSQAEASVVAGRAS